MQTQQKTKLLIEPENKETWRVVARICSHTGLSRDYYPIEATLPDYRTARNVFDKLMKKENP